MQLLFEQRLFSWFDSYDIYDETGAAVYTVKGELSWGHRLRVYDASGREVGLIQEKSLAWLPKFEMYLGGRYIGLIQREFSFFTPKFFIDCNGWQVEGDWMEWDYTIVDRSGNCVATLTKKLWHLTDTYLLNVFSPKDALCALLLVLAIDAEKCSRGK